MYSTCMFCNHSLGENQIVEHFPVGRRLAFDSDKGRLWVVCRRCERWNLSPIEERWEAIEDCERLFGTSPPPDDPKAVAGYVKAWLRYYGPRVGAKTVDDLAELYRRGPTGYRRSRE